MGPALAKWLAKSKEWTKANPWKTVGIGAATAAAPHVPDMASSMAMSALQSNIENQFENAGEFAKENPIAASLSLLGAGAAGYGLKNNPLKDLGIGIGEGEGEALSQFLAQEADPYSPFRKRGR